MHVDACIFIDGKHAYAGKYCPHDAYEDESGPIYPEGWTTQQEDWD